MADEVVEFEEFSLGLGEEQAMNREELEFLSLQDNLTEYFTEELTNKIGQICLQGFNVDWNSLADWRQDIEQIRSIAQQKYETKTFPWPNASNVKYPMILVSALQFNARAYPTIVNNSEPVLVKVQGEDDEGGTKQKRAARVSRHMSWQLMEEMDEWEEEMDKLLLALPLDGCAFKKIYYDPTRGRNVSEFVLATDLVVNASTISLLNCPRTSFRFSPYPHEVQEQINMGIYQNVAYDVIAKHDELFEPKEFIEQHTWYDVDGDGYPEPYIVTLERATGKVARILPNFSADSIITDPVDGETVLKITPTQYFVKFDCFPDLGGGFYGRGFGQLLKPLNDATDALLNQLIDAGTLANTGGGFLAKGFRMASGAVRWEPGEWKKVDTGGIPLKEAILPLPANQPSTVLFSLLSLLIEAGDKISSIQEVMTGGGGGSGTPATTVLALIEQGMKVYTAIFKRVWRSLRNEFKMLYELNSQYVSPQVYKMLLDDPLAIAEGDYEIEGMDIIPAADPSMATDIQKAARAEVLNSYADYPVANLAAIMKEGIEVAGIPDADRFILPPPKGPTPEQQIALGELEIKFKEVRLEEMQIRAKVFDTLASSVKKMTEADATEGTTVGNMEVVQQLLEMLTKTGITENEPPTNDARPVSSVEGTGPPAIGLSGPQNPV